MSSSTTHARPNLHIYTDGSHLTRSSNPAGWGFVSVMNEDDGNTGTEIHRSNGVVVLDDTYPGYLGMQVHTNNTGELSAFGECLYWLYEQPATDVTILTDSAYVINTMQGTFNGEANKPAYIIIRNLYQYVSKKHNLNIQHVRSHTGNVWNTVADTLAKAGAKLSLNLLPFHAAQQRQSVLQLAMTPPSLSCAHNEPLKLLKLSTRSKYVFDYELLRRYSDTECPLAMSEIYEWIISKENVDDKCKMTKNNFCNMTLLDQVKECHAWGVNIDSIPDMLCRLQQTSYDLQTLQCPYMKEDITHMQIYQLIQAKYWIKEKIVKLTNKYQSFQKAAVKYVNDSHQEASVAQQRMDYKNSLQLHTQIASEIDKKLKVRVSSNQQFRSSRISPENGTTSANTTSNYLEVDQEIHLLFPLKQPGQSNPIMIPHPTKEVELTLQGTKSVHQIGNLQEFYNSLEISENQIGGPHNARTIKVATININKLNEEKLHHLCFIIQQQCIDVLGIVDTRITSSQAKWMNKCVRQTLSSSTCCYHALAQRKKQGTGPCCPGGIMVIVSHLIGSHPITIKQDPMKMGLILQVIIPMQETSLQVITTYWPSIHQHNKLSTLSGSVHQRCLNYAKENFIDTPAVELLQQTIDNMILEMSNTSTAVIIMGDFNQKWENQVIKKWAIGNQMVNTPIDIQFFKSPKLYTYESQQGNTIIDHIIHRTQDSTHLQPIKISMIHGTEWRLISDHNILIVTFNSQLHHVQSVQHNPAITTPPIIELNLDRRNIVRTFRTRVTEWTMSNAHILDLSDGAEVFLDKLAAQSVHITDKLTNKKSKKFSIYDAPREYSVYQGILRTLHSMRKHWKGEFSQLPSLHVWDGFAKKYSAISGLTEGDVEALMVTVDSSATQWTAEIASKSTAQLLYKCQRTISLTITILNRIRRRAARAKYKDFHDRREQLRQQGRLRTVISSVLGDSKPKSRPTDFNLHTLRNDKGQLETDPMTIHNMLTSNFDEWYRAPCAHDAEQPVDLKMTALRLMNDRKFFDNYMHKTGLTIGQLDAVYQAIQIKVLPQVVEEMETLLYASPTWEEFITQIKRVPKNSTPGPSGLTYNMMKAWSIDTKRSVYEALVKVWENRTIPEAWRWRWLVVIPKTKDLHPAMNLLRPLTMVETYRKVWLGIINNKIQRLLEQYHVLHPSQNGSRFAHGTCTASLTHVYHMETILEQHGSLHRSSWDIKRAFDSVDKVFLRIAWVRLGLPPDLVEWIVNMDEGGTTIIKSPIAEVSWNLMRYKSVIPTTGTSISPSMLATSRSPQSYVEPVLSFTAERGTGQGDVMSPSTWAAFIDILLSMQTEDNSVYLSGEDGCLRRVLDIAYVDDIESSKASEVEIQRKGDIVTTFCRATDLQLSVDKLRRSYQDLTGTMNWLPVQPTRLQIAPNTIKEVPVKVAGFTEYLGIKYDIDINHYSMTQHADTLRILQLESKAVLMSGASLHSKLATLYSSVFPTLKYKARMNCGQLRDFEEYDREIYPLLLHLTRQRHGFPRALLTLSSAYGGIDLMSPTDLIHFEKLMVLFRSLVAPSTSPHHQAARDLLFSAYTRQKVTPVPYQQLDLTGNQGDHGHFLDSLIDWMHSRNMTLHRKGVVRGTEFTKTSSTMPLDILRSWNIYYEEDIVTPYITEEIIQHFGIMPTIMPSTHYLLRQHQFWQIQDDTGTWYAEIVGWVTPSSTVYIKKWKARGADKIVTDIPVNIHTYPYAQLFPAVTASQLLVKRYSFQFHIRECFTHLLQSSAPSLPQPRQTTTSSTCDKLVNCHKNGEIINITVLVSCSSENPHLRQAFQSKQEQICSSCHILIVTSNKSVITESYINITNCHQLDCYTTTEIELFGTVVAMAICHWLSSQYAVGPNLRITYDQLQKSRICVSVKTKGMWLKQCAQYFANAGVKLTVSNPSQDNLKYRTQLSNYVTSLVLPVHIHQMSVAAIALAEEIIPNQMWTVRYKNRLTIRPLKYLHSKDQYEEYTHTRDTKFASTGKWSESTPALFSKVFQLEKRNVLQRAKMTKIIFDWGFHGGNRNKKKSLKSKNEQSCDFCQRPDSNFHWMSDCTHPASVVLRTQALHELREHVGMLSRQLKDISCDEKESSCSPQLQTNLGIESTVYQYILKTYDKEDVGTRIWTSNWTLDMQNGLVDEIHKSNLGESKMITLSNVNCLRRSLLSAGRILGKCLEEIWNHKAGLIRGHYTDIHKAQSAKITVPKSKRSTRKDINYDERTESVPLPSLPGREQRILHPTDTAANQYMYVANSLIPGAGLGAFASKFIPKDTIIATYSGYQTLTASLTSAYVFYNPVSRMHIDALLPDGTMACAAARINDKLIADSASTGFFIVGKGKKSIVVIKSIRDIAENDEVTIEYGHEYWRDGGFSKEITMQACKAYKKTKDPVWKQLLQTLDEERTEVREATPVELLNLTLESQFEIIDIAPDGNCMFNAIAHQMRYKQPKWNTITGSRLRETVCSWLRHNQYYTLVTPSVYEIHARADTFPVFQGNTTTWTEYCERTSRTGEWGEGPHIFGLSVIYNLDITIHTLNGDEIVSAERPTSQVHGIHLALYNPYPHYASLIPKQTTPSLNKEDLSSRWVTPSKEGSIKFEYITEAITHLRQQPKPNPSCYYQDWAKANIPLISTTTTGSQFLIDRLQSYLSPSATQEDKVQHKENFTISEVMMCLPNSVGLLNGLKSRNEAYHLESIPGVSYDMYLLYTLESVEVCFGVRTPIKETEPSEDESNAIEENPAKAVKKKVMVKNPKPCHSGVYEYMRKFPDTDVKAQLRQQLDQLQRDLNTRWDTTNGTVQRHQIKPTGVHRPSISPKHTVPSLKVKAKTCKRRKGCKSIVSHAITNYLPIRTSKTTSEDIASRGRPPPKPPPEFMVETTVIDGTHAMITTHSMVGKNKHHFKTSYIQNISTTPRVEIVQITTPVSRSDTSSVSNTDKLQRKETVLHIDTDIPLSTTDSPCILKRYANRLDRVVQSNHPCLQSLGKSSGQPNHLIKEYKGHRITLETFQRLRPGIWLNDEIINYYFQLLQDKDPNAWYLSTFFIPTLINAESGYNYKNVRRWSQGRTRSNRHINVLQLTRMYIPINHSNLHWTLIVVDIPGKNILHLDSLLPRRYGEEYCKSILRYIQDETADKQQIPIDVAQWTITMGTTQPQQENEVDCGMYVIMYADCLHHNIPLRLIEAGHIPILRQLVAISIYEDKVATGD